jgi:putative ABC transport system ATP-binding protein
MIIQAKGLIKEFKSGGNQVKAVDGVNLELEKGVFAAIVGKSGCGKSTLLGLLGALDKPTSGSIEVDGQEITKMSDWKLVRYRAQKIGFVFQGYNLIPNLSALENVMLPMEFAGVHGSARKKRAKELLEQVGLTEEKHKRKPTRLSGGEQQRVAIARALANKPSIVFADEPTGNLDSQNGKMIFELLHALTRSEKTTIIVVTHDLSIAGQTDKIFHMSDGKITKG